MTDGPRVGVIPGDGVVLRADDTIVVIGRSANTVTPQFVDDVNETIAKHAGDDQWRHLAALVLQVEEPPPLAVVTIEGDAASLFLYGEVEMSSADTKALGTDHVLGVTRQIAVTDGFRVTAPGRDGGEAAPWSNLASGTVRGCGITVAPEGDGTSDLPRTDASAVADDGGSDPTPAVGADEGPAADIDPDARPFESISLRAPVDLSERSPLPVDSPAETGTQIVAETAEPAEADAPDESGPAYERPVIVMGVYSPRGFFNHPDAKYCSRTGVKMGASHTRVLVEGPRPPLGVVTLDDGSTHTVQWNTVIGRGPATDERVKREEVGALVVADEQQSVSRAHALLELVGWDVLVSDLGSRNHTYVQDGPDRPRRQLAVGERAALRSGITVHLGERSFVYHEHHVR